MVAADLHEINSSIAKAGDGVISQTDLFPRSCRAVPERRLRQGSPDPPVRGCCTFAGLGSLARSFSNGHFLQGMKEIVLVVATMSVLSESDIHGRAFKMECAELVRWLILII